VSSKNVEDFVFKSRRKAMPTTEEITRLSMIREVYHETSKDHDVCVVLPDGVDIKDVFGTYYPSVHNRLQRKNVFVTDVDTYLTDGVGKCNTVVIDLSDILITS